MILHQLGIREQVGEQILLETRASLNAEDRRGSSVGLADVREPLPVGLLPVDYCGEEER